MAGARLREAVVVVGLGEGGALLAQPREAAGQLRAVGLHQLGGELVHGHDHHQVGPGRWGKSWGLLGEEGRRGEDGNQGQKSGEPTHQNDTPTPKVHRRSNSWPLPWAAK